MHGYAKELKETGHNINEMFLTAKQKAKKNYSLAKEMVDNVDKLLPINPDRICKINENWNLHFGVWPELESYVGRDAKVFNDPDGNEEEFNPSDFIVHHPKINNVTNMIMGDIVIQPLIPIVRDFSSYGRKYREEVQLEKLRAYYYQNIFAPIQEQVQQEYLADNGISDPLLLGPEEQQQMSQDLQRRMRQAIPRNLLDDLKKIDTPDEKIRQVLLTYDIRKYDIEEKFIQGGEQAVMSYEEYYKVGRVANQPVLDVLNSKWVTWSGGEKCDYVEDGSMAKYEQYLTPHEFVTKYGHALRNKDINIKEVKEYFSEIPGFQTYGGGSGQYATQDMFMREHDLNFVDALAANPHLVPEDWRTRDGMRQLEGIYSSLASNYRSGLGIREIYTTFKWTESLTYVERYEDGKLNSYIVGDYYKQNKNKDVRVKKYLINRVYHGSKIADRFYMGVEPVPWQFFGGLNDFNSKLTICGRNYAIDNGTYSPTNLIEPAKIYQFRYNVTASKLEELEKRDLGKIVVIDTSAKPQGWTDQQYFANLTGTGFIPTSKHQIGQDARNKPVYVEDAGSSNNINLYSQRMEYWEAEIYKAMGINKDALGQANPYQSNAQTQGNILLSQKRLIQFHNRRRLVKQRILNYFNNISLLCLLDDKEKQATLFDDFSRLHLEVNEEFIKQNNSSIFVVDDYSEAQNLEAIRSHVLAMLQNGVSINEVLALFQAKSISEMKDIAQEAEIRMKEEQKDQMQNQQAAEQQAQQMAMQMEQYKEELKAKQQERNNQVKLEMANINADIMKRAADVDSNQVSDSIQRTKLEIAAKEKIEADKRAVEREKIRSLNQNK